tara:strand:- start:36 stop:410 length:375 start_codon:yes stop_codon:yes gene_type:complete
MQLKNIKINKSNLKVKFAKTKQEHKQGLMGIDSLPEDQGMLFCYPGEQKMSFWMKDTKIPLSIAFIDKNKKIIAIEDMKPLDTSGTKFNNKAQWALEVNQGWFEKNNIKLGDKVNFNFITIKIT